MTRRPNVLVILTDQLRYPPAYESDELAEYRREHLPGVERLRQDGMSFSLSLSDGGVAAGVQLGFLLTGRSAGSSADRLRADEVRDDPR